MTANVIDRTRPNETKGMEELVLSVIQFNRRQPPENFRRRHVRYPVNMALSLGTVNGAADKFEKLYDIWCSNLSASGIAFLCTRKLFVGSEYLVDFGPLGAVDGRMRVRVANSQVMIPSVYRYGGAFVVG